MARQPLVILLTGAPAGGKSTIARAFKTAFEERFSEDIYWLATDALRSSFECGDYREPVKQAIYDGMFAIGLGLNKAGCDLLLDANFIDETRLERFQELGIKDSVAVTVLVRCELATREDRNRRRPEAQQVDVNYLRKAHRIAEGFAVNADLLLDTESLSGAECALRMLEFIEKRSA